MKGMIIRSTTWKGETLRIGTPDGCSVCVEFFGGLGATWNPGAYSPAAHESMSWGGGELKVGDEVELELAELDEADVAPPIETSRDGEAPPVTIDDPNVWMHKLYDYMRYKKILEDEGVINKD